jgi:hypothetical protein
MAYVGVGLDEAWDRATPQQLLAYGARFVCRYLGEDVTGKNLTYAEARVLSSFGIGIVSNYEYNPGAAKRGFAEGQRVARLADAQHRACGGPGDRPIYFSVDFDASSADLPAIGQYFAGIASVIGVQRTGAYGEFQVIKFLFDVGAINWGWQTYAWSNGAWDPRAQLRQVLNGIHVAGHDMDRDEAQVADVGAWVVEGSSVDINMGQIVGKGNDGRDRSLRDVLMDLWYIQMAGKTSGGPLTDSYILRRIEGIAESASAAASAAAEAKAAVARAQNGGVDVDELAGKIVALMAARLAE